VSRSRTAISGVGDVARRRIGISGSGKNQRQHRRRKRIGGSIAKSMAYQSSEKPHENQAYQNAA